MRKTNAALVLFIFVLYGCSPQVNSEQAIFEGVWSINKIERDNEQTQNLDPLPSLIIFTKKHYSIVWMPGDTAIEAFAERWSPTNEEKIQRYEEIVVNTGTYEIEGTQIEVRPVIARIPEFIGGLMIYEYEKLGDSLTLTLMDEYTFDGVQAPWVSRSSGQTRLSLSRLAD